jgi:hypothetical protein
MASRSLTEVFILMRNNAMQSRHIYSEQVSIPHVFPDAIAWESHELNICL